MMSMPSSSSGPARSSRLSSLSDAKLEWLIAECRDEIAYLEALSQSSGPCAVRRGIIAGLQKERALYARELRAREES